MRNKIVDPGTEQVVRSFVGRLTGRYDVAGAILFGSERGAIIARTAMSIWLCC